NVVSGRARMIAGGEATAEETKENAVIILEQAQRMTRIIRQLLDFARRRGAHKSPADLRQVAGQTVALLTPLADKKEITLVLDQGEHSMAEVDTGQMQQALTNLIVNGIQAMPKGGKINVALSEVHARPPADHAGAPGEWVRLSVTDEGEGMAPET